MGNVTFVETQVVGWTKPSRKWQWSKSEHHKQAWYSVSELAPQRTCAVWDCRTVLSRYNDTAYCATHARARRLAGRSVRKASAPKAAVVVTESFPKVARPKVFRHRCRRCDRGLAAKTTIAIGICSRCVQSMSGDELRAEVLYA